MEAMLQQSEIKRGVLHELGSVCTSPLACKSLCPSMRTSMQRINRYVWTSSIQIFDQNRSLQGSIGAEAAQHGNTNTTKCGPLPFPHHHPNLSAALLKFNVALSMRFHQPEHTRKDATVHPA